MTRSAASSCWPNCCVEFDNLTGDLMAHKSLCMALTSEFMSGRILGVSKTATVGTRALFLSSGNNVGPVRDMTRRCITIRLSPSARSQRLEPFSDLILYERYWATCHGGPDRRPRLDRRRSDEDRIQALAGYGDWSDLCRQPLLWLGCKDPTASVFEAIAEDPDRETLARLLGAWVAVFGKTPAMVRAAVRQEHAELREVLLDIAGEHGEVKRWKLGCWIRQHAGRIVDGKRFVRASGATVQPRHGRWRRWNRFYRVLSVSRDGLRKCLTDDSHTYARASRGDGLDAEIIQGSI
jgi:hypothetical protein